MKKKAAVLLIASAVLAAAGGCSSTSVSTNTVELQKDGSIMEYTIEDFGLSYYDADELESFIDEQIESWLDENEGEITIKTSEVEDGTAILTLKYDSADTFASFSGVECFSGSILAARSAGYTFDTEFLSAEDADGSSDSGSTQDEGSLSAEEEDSAILYSAEAVMAQDDLNVLIIGEAVDIIVPGTIAYVSADYVEVTGSKTATVSAGSEDAIGTFLAYILYE